MFVSLVYSFSTERSNYSEPDYYALPQKVAGYYVIPSKLLSVCPSVCPSVLPSVSQRLIIRVRSITLIPFEIISRNLAQI